MASSLAIRKLSQQLQAAAARPETAASAINQLAGRNPADVEELQRIEQAIALIVDDQKRHNLASALYRWLDVQRVWMGDGAGPAPSQTVFTACVPFTVRKLEPIKSPDSLKLLTLALDGPFAQTRDESFPDHRNLVLAAPLVGLHLDQRWAFGFMLANSHRDTPVDRVYGAAWADFIQQEQTPEQAVFAYLFSVSVPVAPNKLDLSRPFELPVTPWAQQALDMLMAHANALNNAHPELGLQLHAMTTMSEAGKLATDLRMRSMFTRFRGQVGRQVFQLPKSGARLAGLTEDFLEETNAKHKEEMALKPVRDEDLYGQVALGRVTVTEGGSGAEFLQANLFSRSGRIAFSAGLLVPLGTLAAQIRQWWSFLDHQGLAEVVELPTEHVSDFKPVLLGKTRDLRGQWVERELLHWGPDAFAVFKTAKWSLAFGDEQFDVVRESSEGRQTLPQMYEQLPMLKAVHEHYQPAVYEQVKRLLGVPGLAREQAFSALVRQFEALSAFQLMDPFNAFLPGGMYAALHHQQANGVLFRVHESVQEQMALTDIDKRFPLALLHSPYPDIYLHFEQRISYDSVGTVKQGWLDGAFISEKTVAEDEEHANLPPGTRIVTLTVAFNEDGEPVSLHYPSIHFLIAPDDDRDLIEMLQGAADRAAQLQAEERRGEYLEAARTSVFLPLLEVCKVLLYVNMPNARLNKELKRTELLERAKGLSGRERQRALEKLGQARDVVRVGPLPPMEVLDEGESGAAGDHRTVKPHPRRGYLRNQPYGEGLKLRRLRWIPPVFVNKKLLSGAPEPVATKTYDVR